MKQKLNQTPSLQEPRIWSSVIRGLLLPLAEYNIDAKALLAAHDIDEADLDRSHGEVPLKKYLKFIETAALEAEDPLLGARLARSAGPEALGAIGFLFLSSHTLSEAISNLQIYLNLLQDATYTQFTHDTEKISYSYQLYQTNDMDCRQDVEFSLALTCRLIRMYGGTDVKISSVTFRHSAAAPKTAYERLFKAPVYFEEEMNRLTIPAEYGQIRGKVLDQSLSRILQDFLDDELKRRSRFQSFPDQVSRALYQGAIEPPITAQKVAKYLGISSATFYRRLKTENVTFGELCVSRNYDLAKNYLLQSSLSITQIAHMVGFAESASFTRAFTRWSEGKTPSAYRKENADKRLAQSLKAKKA